MDITSIAEIIKEIGAILVTLIGVGGAIIANLSKVRGEKEIQKLARELMLESARQPSSDTVPMLRRALSDKKQDVASKNQKLLVYIGLSILFLILGMLISPALIKAFTPFATVTPPPVASTPTSALPGDPTPTSTLPPAATDTPAPTATFTLEPTIPSTPTSTSVPTDTPAPVVCPYQGATDDETIDALIRAEAVAVNTKDLAIIQAIFDPEALFYDFGSHTPETWNGPLARYQEHLFPTTDFQDLERFDILPVGPGISGDTAYYASGSKGYYRAVGGDWKKFFSGSLVSKPSTPYGSDHWILKKNSSGCWGIVQMEFNAGDEQFPR
jgi:hypothetical protein